MPVKSLTRPFPVVPVAFAGLSQSVRSTCAVLYSKISKSGCVGRRKLVLKAFMAADILISGFTNVFIARIIFGSASTELCGSGCGRNRCATMRCKTSQQPLPGGEYVKENLCFMPQRSQKAWNCRQSCSSFVAFTKQQFCCFYKRMLVNPSIRPGHHRVDSQGLSLLNSLTGCQRRLRPAAVRDCSQAHVNVQFAMFPRDCVGFKLFDMKSTGNSTPFIYCVSAAPMAVELESA